jgi:hypothetical protein
MNDIVTNSTIKVMIMVEPHLFTGPFRIRDNTFLRVGSRSAGFV